MSITRPLLAAGRKPDQTQEEYLSYIEFPCLACEKLDGIRCIKVGGQVLSRKFKPIPNNYVRSILERVLPDGIDGELMVPGGFNQVQSAFMTIKGAPAFDFMAFDYVKDSLDKPYNERIEDLKQWFKEVYPSTKSNPLIDNSYSVKLVLPKVINNLEELNQYEEETVNAGYEGVMIRGPKGVYKCGRSTILEGTLLKYVRKFRAEGKIIAFEEQERNDNIKEKDAFGLAKRSTKKEGKVGSDVLGTLYLHSDELNAEVKVGTGFTADLRKDIWLNQDKYLGKTVTFEYRHLTPDGAPRFSVFIGLRSEEDMS